MHILIDPGNYDYRNLGSTAMFQTLVRRLRTIWPTATLQALTADPEGLERHCPGVEPLLVAGARMWFDQDTLLGRMRHRLPASLSHRVVKLQDGLRFRRPAAMATLIRAKATVLRRESVHLDAFLNAMDSADVLVVSGLGGLRAAELYVLDTLEMALRDNKPTAMFGLGLSPEHAPGNPGHDARIYSKLKRILPQVELIAPRERSSTVSILRAVGVNADRMMVTGDDAIEQAYNARPEQLGGGLGVNLSVRPATEVDESYIELLRPILHDLAHEWEVPLVPLPGANERVYNDSRVIRQLFAGYDDASDGGVGLDTTEKIIAQVAQCRVVITGAYHIAVFSLAQGVPTVCLAKSAYFTDKLGNLVDMFGGECEVVPLNGPQSMENVRKAVIRAWHEAGELRPTLLEAAKQQTEMAWRAYHRFAEIVATREGKHGSQHAQHTRSLSALEQTYTS